MRMDFFRYWLYGLPALVVRICRFFASDALNLLFRANSALLNLLFRALLLDLQAFCDFRQLSHHIQKLRTAVHHVMIFSHEQIVGAHMKIAGHGND